jgi:hypothetical protein
MKMIVSSRRRALVAILAGLALLLPAACGKSDSQPEKITKLDPELTEMVRYYQEMKQLGLAGNVDSFWARRDSVSKAFILNMFRMHGSTLDSNVVASWAYTWPDIAGLPLVQDSTDGQWRRLVFIIDNLVDSAGRQKALYPVIMFRKENGQWKVANASRLAAFKFDKQGKEIPFRSLTYHDLFRIPPTFPNLDSITTRDANPPKPRRLTTEEMEKLRKK